MSEELLKNQYKDSSNLDSRIRIHDMFSTNKKDWHLWLFEQYSIPENSSILELGCGNGVFWAKNKHRIPSDWNIILSDFSSGMLQDAQNNLRGFPNIQYKQIDAQDIPFEDNHFDVVIANHMLYHVPDRNKAFKEVRRILKSEGVFYAASNGKKHMEETVELLKEFDPELMYSHSKLSENFGLENGKEQISKCFSRVSLREFEGGLEVTEVQPLVQYLLSYNSSIKETLTGEKLAEFTKFLKNKMQENGGVIKITKSTGLFEAL
jgi:ubiquinone/menaquinone biosynthesis C-methylase UbiE